MLLAVRSFYIFLTKIWRKLQELLRGSPKNLEKCPPALMDLEISDSKISSKTGSMASSTPSAKTVLMSSKKSLGTC
jgi:hypothetical protein